MTKEQLEQLLDLFNKASVAAKQLGTTNSRNLARQTGDTRRVARDANRFTDEHNERLSAFKIALANTVLNQPGLAEGERVNLYRFVLAWEPSQW